MIFLLKVTKEKSYLMFSKDPLLKAESYKKISRQDAIGRSNYPESVEICEMSKRSADVEDSCALR